jgi:hypothetical protein
MVMEDAENGEQIFVDTSDRKFRRRVAELARSREARLRAEFLKAGVEPFEIATDDDLVMSLVRMAEQRKRRIR